MKREGKLLALIHLCKIVSNRFPSKFFVLASLRRCGTGKTWRRGNRSFWRIPIAYKFTQLSIGYVRLSVHAILSLTAANSVAVGHFLALAVSDYKSLSHTEQIMFHTVLFSWKSGTVLLKWVRHHHIVMQKSPTLYVSCSLSNVLTIVIS